MDRAIDLDENFLGYVFGVFCVLNDAECGIIDAVLIIFDEVSECGFIAVPQAVYEFNFNQVPLVCFADVTYENMAVYYICNPWSRSSMDRIEVS